MSEFVGSGGPGAKRIIVLCGDFMEGEFMAARGGAQSRDMRRYVRWGVY
jgi:hypothetical protein